MAKITISVGQHRTDALGTPEQIRKSLTVDQNCASCTRQAMLHQANRCARKYGRRLGQEGDKNEPSR